jgi:hypothetical protein
VGDGEIDARGDGDCEPEADNDDRDDRDDRDDIDIDTWKTRCEIGDRRLSPGPTKHTQPFFSRLTASVIGRSLDHSITR